MAHGHEGLEDEVAREIVAGSSATNPVRLWAARRQDWARKNPRFRVAYLVLVALVGLSIVAVGLILVPLPGPGWLIVFVGLSLLGTEFLWARRLTGWTRLRLQRVLQWWAKRRSRHR